MKKKTSDEVFKGFLETKKLIASGSKIEAAIERTGLTKGSYYFHRAKELKKPLAPSRRPRKVKTRLNIQDLPDAMPSTDKLFMVYGSPTMLANFAKGLT